ncbi:hypothetical protein HCEG_08156 [Histoplasma capsulatum var. duboisii H88]|uniref:Uncharacterized protein n=1 Tax=Ajellomyces capsulatus (strain H88) TaxID=544711 RepID=F0USR4_AJEC8|nr:hypothetical protein HCEG_08156 [Histoplasma capsulatum var. duboisii H88]
MFSSWGESSQHGPKNSSNVKRVQIIIDRLSFQFAGPPSLLNIEMSLRAGQKGIQILDSLIIVHTNGTCAIARSRLEKMPWQLF